MMEDRNLREKLIISADDFGKSELANRNILLLAEAGKLDRVSVMADGKFSPEEIRRLLAARVKLDVHLHLSNWLENKEKIKESFLRRSIIFLSNYLFGIFSKTKTEIEWNNQVKNFIRFFEEIPDGINAHRYDHFFPVYFPLVAKLAKKHKIPRIRFGKIIHAEKNFLTSGILSYFRERNKKLYFASGLVSYNFCVNLDWAENPKKFLNNSLDKQTELVCHPEREDEYNFINKYF